MALCFADSFDSFAATGDLLKKYSTAMAPWTWNSTGGPDGGGCVVAASTGNSTLITPLNIFPTSPTRVCIAFYLKISTPYQYYPYIRLYTNTGVHSARLQVSPNGAWSLTRGDGAIGLNVLNRNICDNRWHWIEVDISTVNAATTNKVWIDGTKEFEGAWNGDMTSTNINYFSMSSIDSSTVSFCNIIAWDDTGSGLNFADFPIGPRSIDAIRPNGDNSVAFTRSTGSTSYTLLDEVNGDITDYVESNVSGTQDLYDYAALGFNPTVINGVMLNTLVHTPLPGIINAQGVCKSGSTTSVGTSKLLGVNPQIIQQAYDLDPNGSIAWTQANLDAAQFGIKVA